MNTKTALIGHTGFVGSNIAHQVQFNELYNSQNIEQIKGREYDLVVCAGARAEKWKANREPEQDLLNIQKLTDCLKTVRSRHFVLASTVDVYLSPQNVDEETPILTPNLSAYGLHRYKLERFAREYFPSLTIIRLPGLFGKGLKKNFIFDMLHNNALHLTDADSRFQFYGLDNVWNDIEKVMKNKIELINFATQPVSAREVAEGCFGVEFFNKTPTGAVFYDMRTRYAHVFSRSGNYLWDLDHELLEIRRFVERERKGLQQ